MSDLGYTIGRDGRVGRGALIEKAGPSRRRRILVVTHVGLSDSVPGGNRWSAMRAHLETLGHEVVVLTSSAFANGPVGSDVIRTADLTGSPTLRRLLRRPPLLSTGTAPTPTRAPNWALARVTVPDVQFAAWALPAAAKLPRLLKA